ncbi:MAG: DUF975 family protein [Patescibacteria group bacterium]|nr:DUF975 family protein [Patescibacteria group bacterium]
MAQIKVFPFKESIKTGWSIARDNFIFFLLAAITLIIFSSLRNFVPLNAIKNHPQLGLLAFVLFVISIFFSILLDLGIIKAILELLDGKKPKFKELFSLSDRVINMFISSLLCFLIVLGGLILFIVPGIIWGLKFSLYRYFIVEKNAGPIEALKLSSQATKGAKWNLFLFGFICVGINILGALCLGIGLFFTIPLTWVAEVFIYRKLTSQMEPITPVTPIPTPTA